MATYSRYFADRSGLGMKLEQRFSNEEAKVVSGKVKTWAEELEKKGLEKGRVESLRESIITLILKRFPQASKDEAKKRLEALNDLEKLKLINSRVLDWSDFEDVWTIPEAENS